MIIECINCSKKFNVNADLIPDEGRTIQCGSCNYVWFFNKNDQINENIENTNEKLNIPKPSLQDNIKEKKKYKKQNDKIENLQPNKIKSEKSYELTKYKAKSNFTFSRFLSYILVFLITFIAILIVIDTFKTSLFEIFPYLEIILFSFFETLKDVELFIKDLL